MALFPTSAIPSGEEKQEVYQPSSGDWNYTHAQHEWPFAGNALGDHETGNGGYVDNTGGDSCIRSLFTFDGNFEITFTGATFTNLVFCLYEISEDASDSSPGDGNTTIRNMTNYWAWVTGGGWSGHGIGNFVHNNTSEGSSHTPSDGDVIKLERVSGAFKYYTGSTLRRTFSTTSTNPVRLWIGSSGGSQPDIDNMQYIDYEGIQRDGYLNFSTVANQSCGKGTGYGKAGILWSPTRTGEISSVTVNVASISTSYNAHWELWSHNGTNPGSQIGNDSDTSNISSTGNKTITWSSKPTVNRGTYYWLVLVDEGSNGSINLNLHEDITKPNWGSSRHDTITSMAENTNISSSRVWKCEIKIETTSEPTPDWDTLALVRGDGTNGNSNFTDSSPYSRTVSAIAGAHFDSGQAKFGSTAIYTDGSGDAIEIADSADFAFTDQFTIDFWVYFNGAPANNAHICGQGGNSASNFAFMCRSEGGGNFIFGTSNGSTQRFINPGVNIANQWAHVALVRSNGHQKLFINGTLEGSITVGDETVQNVSANWEFGGGNNSSSHIAAWWEEIRISRVARWDANFTPPTAPYPEE